MNYENVKKSEMLQAQKRQLRTEAELRKKMASDKIDKGDFIGAKNDLQVARNLIQQVLLKVRELGERGISERSIKDDIEDLWRKVTSKINED
ncbi:MAG: hypothetical protein U9O98_06495 [Asgard group archaeon]|nr:hypothetical protein [Asgard group archaeon]